MPPVVGLIIGLGLAGAGITAATTGALIGFDIAIGTAISMIFTGATMIIGGAVGMAQKPPSVSSLTQQGSAITVKQSAAMRDVVYGRTVKGGVITYIATTGTNNEFLHLVVTFAAHEVDAIEAYYFDQYQLVLSGGDSGNETSQYNGVLSVERKLGAAGEAAFPGLITDTAGLGASAWTSSCRQDGCCSVHFKLKWDQNKWPNGASFNMRAKIRGKKVFDTRSSTTAWSNNWALCVRDWLLDPVFGLKCGAAELNDTLLQAAANLSDEAVALLAGGTESRYTCNGGFDASKTRGTVISALLTAGAGRLAPIGGQWSLYGGAWRAPALTLGDDDLRGGLQLTARKSRRDLASGVKGDFVDPNNDWQSTAFPGMVFASYVCDDSGVTGAVERGRWLTATAYSVNDAVMSNGFAYVCTSAHTSAATTQPGVGASWPTKWNLAPELNWKTVSYPFTTSAATAQRLAKLDLETGRRQVQLALPCKLQGYLAQCPEVIQFTHSDFAWSSKTFEIVQGDLTPEADGAWGVDYSLQESDANVYAWSTAFEQSQQAAVAVSVADPRTAGLVSGITLASGASTVLLRGDGIRISRIQVNWTAPADQFVLSGGKIFCEYQVHASGNWQPAFECDGATTIGFITDVNDGIVYDVRLRARNVYDVYSAFVEVDNHTVSASASNYSYRPLSNPLTATDAGASDTVNIAAFTMRVGGNDLSISLGSIGSLSRKTLYFIYYTDGSLLGGSVSFSASTTKEAALAGSGKFYIGSIVTPDVGAPNTIGNNDGGAGAQTGSKLRLAPSQYVPLSVPGAATITDVPKGIDSDAATFAEFKVISAGGGSSPEFTAWYATFPSVKGPWKSLTLYVKSSVPTNSSAVSGSTARLDYYKNFTGSSAVGTSGGTIFSTGLGATRAVTLDSVSLPLDQNLGQLALFIDVLSFLEANGVTLTMRIFEIYVEGEL